MPVSTASALVFTWPIPTGWAECISEMGLSIYVCLSSLPRWSTSLLVGFTDPYNQTYSESL